MTDADQFPDDGAAGLPEGLTARPLTLADAEAFWRTYAAAELLDAGEVAIELEDVESDWARPSLDLARHTVGVFDGDRLVAGSDVYKTRRADGAVHPDYRSRGIGTWLARWTQRVSQADGGTRVGMTVPAGSSGEQVFINLGYDRGWTSWVLRLPGGQDIPDRPLPQGFTLQDADDDAALHDAYQVIEDAFNEWPERQPSTYADWYAGVPGRAGFEPWQLRLLRSPEGEPVGACALMLAGPTAYVSQVATRADHRGLGLGQVLLADAFANGRAHGSGLAELSTDSRTGALGLYEKLGMQVVQTWHHWQIDL